jgi:hypothetical protein
MNANDLQGTKTVRTHGSLPILRVSAFLLRVLSPFDANKSEDSNCAAADKEQQCFPVPHKPHLVIRRASSSPQISSCAPIPLLLLRRRGKTNEISASTQSDHFGPELN